MFDHSDASFSAVLVTDSTQRLYFLVHASNAALGSELLDITPQPDGGHDCRVTAFDVFEDKSHTVHLAAAVHAARETVIYHASFTHRALVKPQEEGLPLEAILKDTLKWTAIKNNEGPQEVTSVVCGPPVSGSQSQAAFQLTVGVAGTKGSQGFPYVVDPSPEATDPWVMAALPKSSSGILEMQPTANGLLILFEQSANQGPACNFRQFDPVDGQFLADDRVRMEDRDRVGLGKPQAICGFQNIQNETDLLVGGSEGLGFYNWHSNTAPSEVLLRGKSIKQVVASELQVLNMTQAIVSKIAIFAVTDQGELHFIEGVRDGNGDVNLRTSGLPIRKAVHLLSSQYNSERRLCELVYVIKHNNEIRHLFRDEQTSLWTDTPMVVQAAQKATTFPAYVISLSFASQSGEPVPLGYEVELGGDPVSVLIDDCSYFLDHRGLRVPVGPDGRLTLVIPTSKAMDFPMIRLGLPVDGLVTEVITLDPAARVKKQLSKYKTGADLQNARGSTGKLVFTNLPPEQANEAADILSQLPKMLEKVGATDDGTNRVKDLAEPARPTTSVSPVQASAVSAPPTAPASNSSAPSDFWKVVDDFIGDALQAIEEATYVVFKAVFDVVGPALELILTIAGKTISIIVRTRRAVLRATVQALGSAINRDPSGLIKLLGLEDDSDDVLKTQQVLNRLVDTMMTNVKTFVTVNEQGLHKAIDALRDELQNIVPDKRPEMTGAKRNNPLEWLLDSPVVAIIRRILGLGGQLTGAVASGISRAWQDSMAKRYRVPDLTPIAAALRDALSELMDSGLTQALGLVGDIISLFQDSWDDPSKAADLALTFLGNSAWRLFDLVTEVVGTVVALMRKVIVTLTDAMKEEWHLPGLTPLWKEFSGQEFSIINFATYSLASLMNKFFMVTYGQLPFEVLGDVSASFQPARAEDLDIFAMIKTVLKPEVSLSKAFPSEEQINSNFSAKMQSNDADVKIATRIPSDRKPISLMGTTIMSPKTNRIVANSAISPTMVAAKRANVGNGHSAFKAKPAKAATHDDDAADPHYKADKRSYETYQSWTGLVGSIARCFACSLELVHLRHARKAQLVAPGKEVKYRWGMFQFLQMLCGLVQFGSRVTFFCQLNTLGHSKSARLQKEHDESLTRLVLGNVATTAMTAFGTVFFMLPNQVINEVGAGLMCGSTLFDIWVLRWPSSGIHSWSEGTETVSEMIASVSGLVTVGASSKKVYKAAVISCAVDAGFTAVAVVAGIVHLVHLRKH
ncbi:hypothetical protein N658DRAFT_331626 [Parathielavia hyrcaniae]|uniref:Uncharacterized protein n=1 Tax=Parathielavia hyrcaniae TaxID=113614 RepID=A0AAN6PTN2_9PEZI|nr:hypothetical protein N658DRAFT_331626 [Parathielavia hyrcaniae]